MKSPAAPKDSAFLKMPWKFIFFASCRAPRAEKLNDLDDLVLADLNL